MKAILAGVIVISALPAMAQDGLQVTPARYLCDRGVLVPATYINAGDDSVAVIHVEGQQITLMIEQSASGARYGWPSDGSHYVWWTKGPEATLYWHDGATGQDAILLGGCRQQD